VIVYPRGTDNSWNAGSCCGEAAAMGVDDVGFVRAVVQTVSDQLCVDPGRVYATGMSNGGYMSHRLACEAADMFAAVAPVAGAMGIPDCTPERPVPVVAFHGTEDTLVTYEQGRAAIDQWLALDGCPAGPTEVETFGGSRCEIWRDCDDGVEVQLCTLDPMGHCWPGGSEQLCIGIIGPYSDEIDANARLWSVMSRYRLP
jgi:polyhydroxybutyrate depolymerase